MKEERVGLAEIAPRMRLSVSGVRALFKELPTHGSSRGVEGDAGPDMAGESAPAVPRVFMGG